jgi:hypothetical protein
MPFPLNYHSRKQFYFNTLMYTNRDHCIALDNVICKQRSMRQKFNGKETNIHRRHENEEQLCNPNVTTKQYFIVRALCVIKYEI